MSSAIEKEIALLCEKYIEKSVENTIDSIKKEFGQVFNEITLHLSSFYINEIISKLFRNTTNRVINVSNLNVRNITYDFPSFYIDLIKKTYKKEINDYVDINIISKYENHMDIFLNKNIKLIREKLKSVVFLSKNNNSNYDAFIQQCNHLVNVELVNKLNLVLNMAFHSLVNEIIHQINLGSVNVVYEKIIYPFSRKSGHVFSNILNGLQRRKRDEFKIKYNKQDSSIVWQKKGAYYYGSNLPAHFGCKLILLPVFDKI